MRVRTGEGEAWGTGGLSPHFKHSTLAPYRLSQGTSYLYGYIYGCLAYFSAMLTSTMHLTFSTNKIKHFK